MRQITAIWVGNPFFQAALRDLGWRVHCVNPPQGNVLDWNDLTSDAGFIPDVLIVADKSLPPFVTGVESFPCLTAFYVVDSHIHSWYPRYTQAFDLCLVSLRDHIPLFTGGRHTRETVWWSPPYAKPEDIPRPPDPEKPLWDVLFVGTVDPAVNPERRAFFQALAPLVPELHIEHGATYRERATYRELYPQATIVLNHAIANDLNFRVFEALGCGACLVTPLVRHGLEDLFQNGHDLFTYTQDDLPGLATLLHTLLKHPGRLKTVAAQGHATVADGHYMHHRAETFACKVQTLMDSGKARSLVAERLKEARRIHAGSLRLIYLLHAETSEDESLKAAYLKAARG